MTINLIYNILLNIFLKNFADGILLAFFMLAKYKVYDRLYNSIWKILKY